jgi:hypothetical protein
MFFLQAEQNKFEDSVSQISGKLIFVFVYHTKVEYDFHFQEKLQLKFPWCSATEKMRFDFIGLFERNFKLFFFLTL